MAAGNQVVTQDNVTVVLTNQTINLAETDNVIYFDIIKVSGTVTVKIGTNELVNAQGSTAIVPPTGTPMRFGDPRQRGRPMKNVVIDSSAGVAHLVFYR